MNQTTVHSLVLQKRILLNKSCIVSVQSEFHYSAADQKEINTEIKIWFESHPDDIFYFDDLWHEVTPIGKEFLHSVYVKYTPIEYHIIQTSLGEVHKLRPGQYHLF